MQIHKLKFTKLQNRIFRFLSIYPEKTFHQSLLAKELKVSPTAIAKALPTLDKYRIIHRSSGVMTRDVALNRENPQVIGLKRAENLLQLFELDMIKQLESPGCSIVLFGSYALGEDISSSDIDIAVIGTNEVSTDMSQYEKKLKRKINIQAYPELTSIHNELRTSIINGILLSGMIEL